MALSRNARRIASKLRASRRETDAHNSALVKARSATVRANLSGPRPSRSSAGIVSAIYSGAANPVGYTRPMRYSRKASECRTVVAKGSII